MSTSDRELLELAAKAAGIDGKYFESEEGICIHTGIYRAGFDYYWNPLLSDSEALRLVCQLRLDINFYDGFGEVFVDINGGNYRAVEDYRTEMASAVRRAIVRAAAEIGRTM